MACKSRPAARSGIAAPYVALTLMVLMGILALAVDGGVLKSERRHGQAVADATALAAASALYLEDQNRTVYTNWGLDTDGSALESAHTTSAANGYTYNGAITTVTVNMPPLSGPHAGMAHYAEAIVQYSNPRSFSRIWGATAVPSTARAVARGWTLPYTTAGIVVLNPTVQNALNVTGGGNCNVNSGAVIVDSNNSQAAVIAGNGSVIASACYITGANPGDSTSGAGYFQVPPGMLQTGQPVTPDPLANLSVPDPSSMAVRSNSQLNINNDQTLQPGRYVGGIAIFGGNIILQPGVYYMDQGGFSMSNGNLTGTGVMIYNNCTFGGGQQIALTGGNWNITAPTSGAYQGVALFQSRSAGNVPISISGPGTCNLIGAVYAKSSPVSVTGAGGATIGSLFVSDTLNVTGAGNFNVDWKGAPQPGTVDIRLTE